MNRRLCTPERMPATLRLADRRRRQRGRRPGIYSPVHRAGRGPGAGGSHDHASDMRQGDSSCATCDATAWATAPCSSIRFTGAWSPGPEGNGAGSSAARCRAPGYVARGRISGEPPPQQPPCRDDAPNSKQQFPDGARATPALNPRVRCIRLRSPDAIVHDRGEEVVGVGALL